MQKKLVLFILILTISINTKVILACGFYPFGEDIRFSFFKPSSYNYSDYGMFNYTSLLFYYDEFDNNEAIEISELKNVKLWKMRCKNKPSTQDIYEVIYKKGFDFNNPNMNNSFISYLLKHNDSLAINYIKFAYNLGPLNAFYDNLWEKDINSNLPERNSQINAAQNLAKNCKDKDLSIRYAFLAIRAGYYNADFEVVKALYNRYFVKRKHKNIMDYWAMYFYSYTILNKGLSNKILATVFENAPDKRFMSFREFDYKEPIKNALKYAKNNKEKASIWALNGIKKHSFAFENIKQVYNLDPRSRQLSFLLIREINKLEDWIYTPYYSLFSPSLEEETNSFTLIKKRISEDRLYAQKLLDLLNKMQISKVENEILFRNVKAYLYQMTGKYDESIKLFNIIMHQTKDSLLLNQVNKMKILASISKDGFIGHKLQVFLMQLDYTKDSKFLFAAARELEMKGNKNEAACIYTKLLDNEVYYKPKKNLLKGFDYISAEYFDYMDIQYSSIDIKNLIDYYSKNKNNANRFKKWLYSEIENKLPQFYNLLGIKYLRLNQLDDAINAFKNLEIKFPNDFLCSKINGSIFFNNFYANPKLSDSTSIKYSKSEMLFQLKKYIKMANNKKDKDRDYYALKVANCYFNFTYYGENWDMKRFYRSNTKFRSSRPDDKDYFQTNMAKKYYLTAYNSSKNKHFKALCLRMAGVCEKYTLLDERNLDETEENRIAILGKNKYYIKLKKNYPEYYDDLMSNCESYYTFLNKRLVN